MVEERIGEFEPGDAEAVDDARRDHPRREPCRLLPTGSQASEDLGAANGRPVRGRRVEAEIAPEPTPSAAVADVGDRNPGLVGRDEHVPDVAVMAPT